MFRSIRWSLLFWYGLILVVILTGFGATLYHNLGHAMAERLDERLHQSHRMLFGALTQRHGRPDIRIPDDVARRFRRTDPDAPHYVIWDSSGTVVAQSNPKLSIPPPPFSFRPPRPFRGPADEPATRDRAEEKWRHERAEGRSARGEGPGGRPQIRDRGPWREFIARGPRGSTTILVGERSDDESRRLHEFLVMMLAAGLGTLGLALVGGWFLAGRALAPIKRISMAASGLSASDLSRRIDVERTESELGKLATILNVTFDRLESAFLRQVQFTADASHELRTPLTVVISHAELALRKDRSAADYRGTIETCLKAARRMESVVEGLLTLARADAHELGLRPERFEFSALVDESVGLLESLATPRRVSLQTHLEEVELEGDEARLREVVTNLVTNAILYNRDGGTVSVRVGRQGSSAVLTVADTGIGIPEDDHPRLFERFYRADAARSRDLGGNGLGLAIVKTIVEAHGGSIAFTSREGFGTTFTVTLPLADNATPERISRKDPTPFETASP